MGLIDGAPRRDRPSPLAASAGRRLLVALAACAVLWTAIALALDGMG